MHKVTEYCKHLQKLTLCGPAVKFVIEFVRDDHVTGRRRATDRPSEMTCCSPEKNLFADTKESKRSERSFFKARMAGPALIVLLLLSAVVTLAWKPASSPLMSRFASDVTPDQTPAHPRPTMYRPAWHHLNGLWQVDANVSDLSTPPVGKTLPEEMLVPYPIESPLSGLRRLTNNGYLWQRRVFDAPCASAERTLLHLEAVDWNSTVYVNGKMVGTHAGGYDPFSFDISDALKSHSGASGHELLVGAFDPTGPWPHGKQSRGAFSKPGGIFYTCTSGIWQTVWLECVPQVYIGDIFNRPDFDSGSVTVHATTEGGSGSGMTVNVVVMTNDSKTQVATGHGSANSDIEVSIPQNMRFPWSPMTPYLYNVSISLMSGSTTVDTVWSYFGLRTIKVAADKNGIPRPMLNGEFFFQTGTLDQGFWPDGTYLAPTDEALAYDIVAHKQMGFNMVRKHVKVEPRRWYYHTDHLGLLVWQDMPAASNSNDDQRKQYAEELGRLVMTHRNHPSIIQWETFNEGWGQSSSNFTEAMVNLVKELDPYRLVDDASGGRGCFTSERLGAAGGCYGNLIDLHKYSPPGSPNPDKQRNMAAVLGEFGGILSVVTNHQWYPGHCHAYTGNQNGTQFGALYTTYMETMVKLKTDPGLCASVYTQITDVETECNGMMSYDRVMKTDAATIKAANDMMK